MEISGTTNRDKVLTFEEVSQKVLEFLPHSEQGLKLVLAVTLAAHFKNPVMLWVLLVGVPSSGKTDLVRLVKNVPETISMDNMTLNAFISGERETEKEQVHDLLPQLAGKCWVIKDWTSIFGLDEKQTKKMIGDMVNVFDKEFSKFSTQRGLVSYTSEFTHLGCITPATLNKHTSYLNMVGPRFLFYSIPDISEEEENLSFSRILSGFDRSGLEEEARSYVSRYIEQMKQFELDDFELLSEEVKEYLQVSAQLMANCRGIVILQSVSFRNDDGKDTTYYEAIDKPQIEQPWRGVQQLMTLAKYLAVVRGSMAVEVDDLELIKEIVLSSMPADRSQALKAIKDNMGEITAKELAEKSERSTKTSRRLLDELVALKVLEKIKGIGTVANDYQIVGKFKRFILEGTREFMSDKDEDIDSNMMKDIVQSGLLDEEKISDTDIEMIASIL